MAITQEKADTIAQAYCTNGHNKEQAMLAVGLSKSYARGGQGKDVVYSNKLVKQAIAKIMAKNIRKAERTVQSLDDMYQQTYDDARGLKQPSAAVSAVTGIARLYGMDKNAEVKAETPEPLTQDDLATLRKLSRAKTDDELSGPKLKTA